MTFTRRTITNPIQFEGKGLHTGVPVKMTLHPAEAGVFFRFGTERTEAKAENVTDTTRSTKLGSVGTVEHILSALAGLEISALEIEVDAPEVPGMDGSSEPFVKEILNGGLKDLGEYEVPDLYQRAFLQEDLIKIAAAKGHGHWRYTYDLGARWPNVQTFEALNVVDDYIAQIAPSRTFALSEEIPMLIQHGLGQGLDEDSALILGFEGYRNEPRFEDEPARHKLLDLIGDLFLSGVPIRALDVVAERSGHRANVKAAALIAKGVWG